MLGRLLLVGGLLTAGGATDVGADERRGGDGGNAVTHWNTIATDILPIDPGPIIDSRAFAILHAAIHDAVNGVERRYRPYTADLSSPGASIDAAVATAARDVLVALSPSHQEKIEAEYVKALAAVPDGPAEDDGVALGRRCAKANLDRRAADGIAPEPWPPSQGPITGPVYIPTGEPGDYDFTPPFDAPPLGPVALFPGWGRLKPFVIDLAKHRLRGPDRLAGARYAADLNELKAIGRLHGSTRTADQTEIAFFWFEGEAIWHAVANSVIRQRRLDPWRSARILALMSFAVADGGIAVFEAKYHFRFWRPYTAIRRAAEDDNPATDPDPDWLPLLWTEPGVIPPTFIIPPIPDYPSAAAALSAAAAQVLIHHLGDDVAFEATSPTLPGVTRKYTSFSQAAKETARSRVYGGIHFIRAIDDGRQQGKRIGRVVSRMLPRVHRRP